jgi:hypothetical protein
MSNSHQRSQIFDDICGFHTQEKAAKNFSLENNRWNSAKTAMATAS